MLDRIFHEINNGVTFEPSKTTEAEITWKQDKKFSTKEFLSEKVHMGFQTDELQNWRAIFGEVLLTFSPFPTPKAKLNPDFHQKYCRKI